MLGVQIHFIDHRKVPIGKQTFYMPSESHYSYDFNHRLVSCNIRFI